jgi:hypothetical protein
LAELLTVPLEQLDACWMLLFYRPLEDWILHVRACEMVRLLCKGQSLAQTASEQGFGGVAECERFLRSFFGSDPAEIVEAVCRIEKRERRHLDLMFGKEEIPLGWGNPSGRRMRA